MSEQHPDNHPHHPYHPHHSWRRMARQLQLRESEQPAERRKKMMLLVAMLVPGGWVPVMLLALPCPHSSHLHGRQAERESGSGRGGRASNESDNKGSDN